MPDENNRQIINWQSKSRNALDKQWFLDYDADHVAPCKVYLSVIQEPTSLTVSKHLWGCVILRFWRRSSCRPFILFQHTRPTDIKRFFFPVRLPAQGTFENAFRQTIFTISVTVVAASTIQAPATNYTRQIIRHLRHIYWINDSKFKTKKGHTCLWQSH